MSNKTKKQLLLNLPYFIAGLVCTNLGEAWRIAEGADMSEKLLGFLSALGAAFSNPMPSLHPMDLLIGVCCGAGLRLAVYLKGKNAKKYRHGMEYGSARWGTQKDIEPFEDPVFANNVILTRTERLMMGNRPKNPANARNKNVLVVGGSGSGKTRFWLKPNLLQCHSSYVVTDPKGDIVIDCGQALLKNGYSIRIFNTINFRKSMHYNPFAYIVIDYDAPINEDEEQYQTYFLNMVDESDLLALLDEDTVAALTTCNCKEKCAAGQVNTDCPVCKTNMSECTGTAPVTPEPDKDAETDVPAPIPEKKSNIGMILVIFVLAGAAGAAYYYIKFVKGRKPKDEDMDFFDDEGYEEEPYINEDDEPQIAEDAETDGDED